MADPAAMFTERNRSYVRFVRSVLYPQGLRSYFLRSPRLRTGLRVLDAGCGTGILTLALHEACLRRGVPPVALDAFDLTPAMLDRFRETLAARVINGIATTQADVLHLEALPPSWTGYDLIVSASMMEYLPRPSLPDALAGLKARLNPGGSLVLFITRRNWLMNLMIGRWWESNLYDAGEIEGAFQRAGFSRVVFGSFPGFFRYLALWGYIVEAEA